LKIAEGGWFPLLLGAFCFLLLITWYQGRKLLRERSIKHGIPLEGFVSSLLAHEPIRVQGTAVFLTAHVDYVPVAMLHNLKHNQVLHQRVIFLKISIWDVPYVKDEDRLNLKEMGVGIYLVRAMFGFKETPDMNKIMDLLDSQHGIQCDLMETSFFLARDTVIPVCDSRDGNLARKLFAWMLSKRS